MADRGNDAQTHPAPLGVVVAAFACTLLFSSPATALMSGETFAAFVFFGFPYTFEPVVPDVQYEWTSEAGEMVLAWPLAAPITVDSQQDGSASLVLVPFIEYQYGLKSEASRGLAGMQAVWLPWNTDFSVSSHPMMFAIGPRVDAAGMLGSDGHGVAGATGITFAVFNAPRKRSYASISLMYRQARSAGEPRHSVTLDFAGTMLTELLSGRVF